MPNSQSHMVFLGIGGIGMSALARHYLSEGVPVFGYDRTPTPLTRSLEAEGAQIVYNTDLSAFPGWTTEECTVVYTPALQPEDPWRLFFQPYHPIKRAEALAQIANTKLGLAVAGTHGKTSTSALLTHILVHCDMAPTAFVGGLMTGMGEKGTNFVLGNGPHVVVEADEFDRSFLHLKPFAGAITTTDADHLDIYKDAADLEQAFSQFIQQTEGPVFSASGLPGTTLVGEPGSHCWASHVEVKDGAFHFVMELAGEQVHTFLKMPGRHNVYNALLAASLAHHAGADVAEIGAALQTFGGIARRFQFHPTGNDSRSVLIEDYAHHPTELKALFDSVEELYPDREVCVLFQPHLYSRTKDFMDGFVEQLGRWNLLLLLPIYAAREAPLDGVSSEVLASKIKCALVVDADQAVETVGRWQPEVVLVVGAGDIGNLVEPLKNVLQ